MITLYGISTSRASRCVRALAEIGVPYEHFPIHFNDASTRAPRSRVINPNGRISTFVEGDLVLWDSLAIDHSLVDHFDGGLRPRSATAADEVGLAFR